MSLKFELSLKYVKEGRYTYLTQLTISVVVVEHGHAGLGVPVELGLLPVVGLRQPQAPGAGPPVEAASGVSRGHRDLVSGGVVTSTVITRV